jgi:thioredoxin 1
MSQLTHVSVGDFKTMVLDSATPVVVDFYADWCNPCRALAPRLDELAQHWQGRVRFVKVDVDREPELAGAFRVSSIPTLLFLADGKLVDRVQGIPSADTMQSKLNALSESGDARRLTKQG